jgi:hypothetical protein
MREVLLYGKVARGRVALVDDENFDFINQFRWRAYERIEPDRRPYGPYAVNSYKDGSKTRTRFMHKMITGWPQTDHINHNTLDNQKHNLRPCTDSQNHGNQLPPLNGSSQYKGLCWVERLGKWQVQIRVAGKRTYLGVFVDEEEAAQVYDIAAIAAWGPYAYLNFPRAL